MDNIKDFLAKNNMVDLYFNTYNENDISLINEAINGNFTNIKDNGPALNYAGVYVSLVKTVLDFYKESHEKGDINGTQNLANYYYKQSNYKEAEKYYLIAFEKDTNNTIIANTLGLVYGNLNRKKML